MLRSQAGRATSLPLLTAVLLLGGCARSPFAWHGTGYVDPPAAANLPDPLHGGDSSVRFNGNISLVYFGYTQCPDFCPATLGSVASLLEQLGAEAEDVRFYFVTVDPERDKPEVLAGYLSAFDPRFIGIRPEPESLPALLAAYGATAFVEPAHADADDDVIAHTSRLFLVDQDGKLRAHYPFDTPVADLLADVRQLLGQG